MATRIIMTCSALILALFGASFLFLPAELLSLHGGADLPSTHLAQQLGIALLGLATANWVARNSVLGGIYGRALVSGTFVYYGATFLLQANLLLHGGGGVLVWGGFLVSGVFALLFGLMLFGILQPQTADSALNR